MPRKKQSSKQKSNTGNATGLVNGQNASSNNTAAASNPSSKEQMLDDFQLLLELVGLLPAVGVAADILNALISFARGDFMGVVTSAVKAAPVAGDAVAIAKIERMPKNIWLRSSVLSKECPKRLENHYSQALIK